jgi:hypothetical protein
LVCRIGTTSLTVRSVRTPLIMRKHLRSSGSGCSVSKTSLTLVRSVKDGMTGKKTIKQGDRMNLLVLLLLLFYITDLRCYSLKCVLVILISRL